MAVTPAVVTATASANECGSDACRAKFQDIPGGFRGAPVLPDLPDLVVGEAMRAVRQFTEAIADGFRRMLDSSELQRALDDFVKAAQTVPKP